MERRRSEYFVYEVLLGLVPPTVLAGPFILADVLAFVMVVVLWPFARTPHEYQALPLPLKLGGTVLIGTMFFGVGLAGLFGMIALWTVVFYGVEPLKHSRWGSVVLAGLIVGIIGDALWLYFLRNAGPVMWLFFGVACLPPLLLAVRYLAAWLDPDQFFD